MPFNGSGVFTRVYSWITDAANGLNVDATRMDTDTNDIANGLSDCITRDGQTTLTSNLPMAGFRLTALGAGVADSDSARVDNANALHICEFRLTLTTGVPVTTSDVTAATTLYVSPYRGNKIALYDGSVWHVRTSPEMSIAVPNTTNTMYDLFCYDNAGTAALEALAWTNDTTRATALVMQNGVWSKTGALTRRYIGSFRTTAAAGQTEDSLLNRYVWNYYNRCRRPMQRLEASASWNYSVVTTRQANNSTSNQVNFIIGVSEDVIEARLSATAKSTAAGDVPMSGMALDSVLAADYQGESTIPINTYLVSIVSSYSAFPGVGKHFLAWVEGWQSVAGTGTFFGGGVHGIRGSLLG